MAFPDFIDFLSSFGARMALETPQIVLEWAFDLSDRQPSYIDVEDAWDNLYIRRDDLMFPESETEGDEVLTEAYSSSPSTNYADTDVGDLTEYYYSLFVKYTEYATPAIGFTQDVSRLGLKLTSVYPDNGTDNYLQTAHAIVTAMDGAQGATVYELVSASSTFLTDGVTPGMYIFLPGVPPRYVTIVSVDSETELTVTGGTIAVGPFTFYVLDHHQKLWISGKDYQNRQTLWRWDTIKEVVDMKIDLHNILAGGEEVLSISMVWPRPPLTLALGFLTNGKYIRLPYDPHILNEDANTHLDCTGFTWVPRADYEFDSWTLGNLKAGYKIAGSYYNRYDETICILDSVHQEIVCLNESDGSPNSITDMSGIPKADYMNGLAWNTEIGNSWILGNTNTNHVYSIPSGSTPPIDLEDIVMISHFRQPTLTDLTVFNNPVTEKQWLVLLDDANGFVQSYEHTEDFYMWQQVLEPRGGTQFLYHLDETSGDPQDDGPLGNDGTNSGMTLGVEGVFSTGFEATDVADFIDITVIGDDCIGASGVLSFWHKASTTSIFGTGTYCFINIAGDSDNWFNLCLVNGDLRFDFRHGTFGASASTTLVNAHPSPDLLWHHYLLFYFYNGRTAYYIDGVQLGTDASYTTYQWGSVGLDWAAIGAHSSGSGDTALGVFDEVTLIKNAYDALSMNGAHLQSVAGPNKAWANSGRDYDEYT